MSCSISTSSGSTASGSIVSVMSSRLPLTSAVTTPPPAEAEYVLASSSSLHFQHVLLHLLCLLHEIALSHAAAPYSYRRRSCRLCIFCHSFLSPFLLDGYIAEFAEKIKFILPLCAAALRSSSRICIGAPQSADTFCRILLSTSGTLTAFFAKPGSRCRISSPRGSRPRTVWRPSERCERRWAARFQAASAYSQLTPPAGTLSAASVTGTLSSASVTGTLSAAGGAGFASSVGTGSLAVIGGAYADRSSPELSVSCTGGAGGGVGISRCSGRGAAGLCGSGRARRRDLSAAGELRETKPACRRGLPVSRSSAWCFCSVLRSQRRFPSPARISRRTFSP